MKLLILGRGRVGRGLLRSLEESRVRATLASSRRPPAAAVAAADVVLLAVSDAAIAEVAARVTPSLARGAVVLHAAGARGVDELEACRRRGHPVGVLHPLVSFPDPARPPTVAGATFTLAGDPVAVRAGKAIARAAHARALEAPIHGPAYHAAAALVANGAASLASVGVGLLAALGVERRAAEHAVGGLLRTVAENVERVGVPHALTGPVARGDEATVRAHRAALATTDPDALRAYDAVAPVVLACAEAAGLPSERATAVRRALRGSPKAATRTKRKA